MSEIRPYQIAVADEVLDRIQAGLHAAQVAYGVPGSGWRHGVDPDYLRAFVETWRNDYDWRLWEHRLNLHPLFECRVGDVDIRFQHVRSSAGRATIVLTHGWPGSILEFDEVVDRLAFPERFGGSVEDGFDVIVPGLPGFGFSSRPDRLMGPRAVAALWSELLFDRLKLDRVFLQGGDFGSPVSNYLAQDNPDRVAGLHLNLCLPLAVPLDQMAPGEAEWRADYEAVQRRESAYMLAQMTKPQTVGLALSSSPVAWAAWVLDKFHAWSGRPDDLDAVFDRERLITNLMIYLVNDAVASSIWMYAGVAQEAGQGLLSSLRVEAPTGIALYPDEFIPPAPEAAMRRHWNVQRVTRQPLGGHFAAMQAPSAFADDVRSFFLTL